MILNYLAALISWANHRFIDLKIQFWKKRFLRYNKSYMGDGGKEYTNSIVISGSYSKKDRDKRIKFNKNLGPYNPKEAQKELEKIRSRRQIADPCIPVYEKQMFDLYDDLVKRLSRK